MVTAFASFFLWKCVKAGEQEIIQDWTKNCQKSRSVLVKMRKIVADGWHKSQYLISILTVKCGYDVERTETPNELRLKHQ